MTHCRDPSTPRSGTDMARQVAGLRHGGGTKLKAVCSNRMSLDLCRFFPEMKTLPDLWHYTELVRS